MSTDTRRGQRASAPARRVGYGIGAVVNAVLWWLVVVAPGWAVVPFLSGAAAGVMGLFAVSLAVGFAADLASASYDPPWFKAVGDLVTTGVGLAVAVAFWRVFPFDFGAAAVDWALVARVVLGVSIAGLVVAMIVHCVSLVRALTAPAPR